MNKDYKKDVFSKEAENLIRPAQDGYAKITKKKIRVEQLKLPIGN